MFHYQDDPKIVRSLVEDPSKMFPKFALGDGVQTRQGKDYLLTESLSPLAVLSRSLSFPPSLPFQLTLSPYYLYGF